VAVIAHKLPGNSQGKWIDGGRAPDDELVWLCQRPFAGRYYQQTQQEAKK
jgi:hypothetical protein